MVDTIGGGKVSVGPPFFNAVFVPLMVPMLAVMAAGPFLKWKRGDLMGVLSQLKAAFAFSVAVILLAGFGEDSITAALGLGLAAWLFAGTLTELAGRVGLFRVPFGQSLHRLGRMRRSAWGMTVAHGGLAIAVAGMVGVSAWKVEKIQVMRQGETVAVAGYDYTFAGTMETRGPNYIATVGAFTVTRDGEFVTTLHPENRVYMVQGRPTTEAAIYPTFFGDLYVAIGDPDGDGYVTRIYFNPLIGWIWMGLLVMVAGGLVSLTDRRHRVGAPRLSPSRGSPSPA